MKFKLHEVVGLIMFLIIKRQYLSTPRWALKRVGDAQTIDSRGLRELVRVALLFLCRNQREDWFISYDITVISTDTQIVLFSSHFLHNFAAKT